MTTPANEPLKLTDAIKEVVNGAFARGRPIAVSYVDAEQQPHLSYRGTVQAYGDSELALWARNPSEGIAAAMAVNPSIVLLYGDLNPDSRAILNFRGRGRVDNDETVRKTVFENSNPIEQSRDPERKGVAIIIALDSVGGIVGKEPVRLRRA